MKKFSRRAILKIAGGLFAFVPAVRLLLETTDARAGSCGQLTPPPNYEPCNDENYLLCDEFRECICYPDPESPTGAYETNFYYCKDYFTGQRCEGLRAILRTDINGMKIPCYAGYPCS